MGNCKCFPPHKPKKIKLQNYLYIVIYFNSCHFDPIKGAVANIFFSTVPMTMVLVTNVVLYVLTWWKIHTDSKGIETMLENEAQTLRASHKAANLMSLFVTAFFVQWWALGIISVWHKFAVVPQQFITVVVMFTNLGGVLKAVVYIIIKRRTDRNYINKPLKSSSQVSQNSWKNNSTTNVSVIDTHV